MFEVEMELDEIYFSGFGVKIGIEARNLIDLSELHEKIRAALRTNYIEIDKNSVEHRFDLSKEPDGSYTVHKNGEHFHSTGKPELILEHLESQVRITIAEFAVGKVFLHAGVVGWKKQAIIIPGRSFSGKTTLVAALVKKGAAYYSDEYAVVDEEGFVHPFPKMLSLRGIIDDYRQVDIPAEQLNGRIGSHKIPAGLILFTQYEAGSQWAPQEISAGESMMELIRHTIPITNNPSFSLDVLNKLVKRAILSKSQRGEADLFADIILRYFETESV